MWKSRKIEVVKRQNKTVGSETLEKVKILKSKLEKYKKVLSQKFEKVKISKWKRAKIKKVESENFGNIRNIEDQKGNN